jgi:class 3 adenylate cyclase
MTLTTFQSTIVGDSSSRMAWLEAVSGERYVIESGCSLGRSASNQVPLPGEKVSRQHAIIQARGSDAFWLADAGSVNGTWLNGRRILQATRIYNGDRIGIGPHRLIFHHPSGQPRSRPEPSIAEMTIRDRKAQYSWLLMVQLDAPSRLEQTVGAARVPSLVGGWLERCRELVQDRGGRIHQYIGHGFLAAWCDHGENRLAVAATISELAGQRSPGGPPFRVVLHYGQVNVCSTAALGDEGLSGAAVNFAFRVDKLASGLKVSSLVSEVAQALLKPHLRLVEAGQHRLPGFEGEQSFYRVGTKQTGQDRDDSNNNQKFDQREGSLW